MGQLRIVEYVTTDGVYPFAHWFDALDSTAAARVATAIYRLAEGNLSNVKTVGGGVFERRIDFGAGYRIYFARLSESTLMLLGGGTKQRQQASIDRAKAHWREYRQRS